MVRLINASPRDGSLLHEDICWTNDFTTPAKEFVRRGYWVHTDKKIDIEFDSRFPINITFSR